MDDFGYLDTRLSEVETAVDDLIERLNKLEKKIDG